jgi:GntR family transcriptional regulator
MTIRRADHLREGISSGRLGEGDQLPSEAQLMEYYGVARMTVRSTGGDHVER